ncbi:MAG: hypothetical protein Q8Q85_01340 [Gemmatimonadales bacterium]|nr:hypothetical protein [Gemmatimonadales bacterium]
MTARERYHAKRADLAAVVEPLGFGDRSDGANVLFARSLVREDVFVTVSWRTVLGVMLASQAEREGIEYTVENRLPSELVLVQEDRWKVMLSAQLDAGTVVQPFGFETRAIGAVQPAINQLIEASTGDAACPRCAAPCVVKRKHPAVVDGAFVGGGAPFYACCRYPKCTGIARAESKALAALEALAAT